jgi:hypothetical protein
VSLERLAINVTVSEEEYEFIRLQAYLNRSSMSAYVRKLIAKDKEIKKSEKPQSKK